MRTSRREFLVGLSLLSAAGLTGSFPVIARAAEIPDNRYLMVGSGTSICAINLKNRQVHSVPVGFLGHGFVQNPLRPERVWAIEKWGRAAVEIDFKKGEVSQRMTCPETAAYFGHGFFAPEGNVLYIVQTDLLTGLGHLIGYDNGTFAQVRDYQVTPGALHDCHLLPDQTFLVVSHGSTMTIGPNKEHKYQPMLENSSLMRFDPRTNKVVDKKSIEDKDQILAHFAVTQNGSLIAIGLPRPETDPTLPTDPLNPGNVDLKHGGAVYFGGLDEPGLRRVVLPDDVKVKLRGEVLSIAVDEAAHLAAVTNPASKTVLFIDLTNGIYIGQIGADAYGISYDPVMKEYLCSGGKISGIPDNRKDVSPFPVKTMTGEDFPNPFTGGHNTILEMTI